MATVRYRFSCWIRVLLLLSSFHIGDCQGPNKRGCNCGETAFSGSSGTVTSPYYPNNYRNRCRCRYTITVTSPNRIRLQFHSLDFGDNTCQQDSIRVFDGQDTSSKLITRFCSNRNTPTTVTSKTQNLIIWFVSDSRKVGGGFRATYSIISPTTDAPTTHITTLPTTHTTPSTTRVTTPLMTSTAKSTSVLTSTFAATTKKDATIPITRERLSKSSKGPRVISTTSTTSVTFQNINEMISTARDNISTTEVPTLSTNVLKKQAQSSLLRYAWILPITIVVILIVLAVFLLCFVKRKRSGKTSKVNGNRGTTDSIPPDALAADGTTVIVNQTYQSNDDFIPDIVYQPVGDDVVNGNTVKTERNNTGLVESKSDLDSQTSPVYQTTKSKNSESDPEVTAHNYDLLLGDKSPSGDGYQSPGDSAYQYADFDKSEYQYAGSTRRYDYAEASTLPVSAKYTAKQPATYEALNPLDREPDASIHERSTFTENVAYATADPVQSSRYMGLEEAANKPYQELLMTTGEGFAEDPAYSGVEMDEGYLYPDVSKMNGKEFSQEAGYDQVSVGVYAAVGETSKDESNFNSVERSGTLPNSDAYDVVNVNSEDTLTKAQQSGKFKNDDVVIGDTYETLNYRDPSEMNLSYNETGYIDYKASGTSSYQPLKTNVNSLFGLKPHRR